MALGFFKKMFSFGNAQDEPRPNEEPVPQPQPAQPPAPDIPAPAEPAQPDTTPPEFPDQPLPGFDPAPETPEIPAPAEPVEPKPEPAPAPAPQEIPPQPEPEIPAPVRPEVPTEPSPLPPEDPPHAPLEIPVYEARPVPEVPLEVPQEHEPAREQPLRDLPPVTPQPPRPIDPTLEARLAPAPLTASPPLVPTASTRTGRVTVGKAVETYAEATPAAVAQRSSWLQRMRAGLSRSSRELGDNLSGIFTKGQLTEEIVDDLEEVLIRADLGVETAMRVTDVLSSGRFGRQTTEADVRRVMAAEIETVLAPVAKPLELDLSKSPHVILVVGVNGTGKTTTIGKLAAKLTAGGVSVMLAAGDTFRAAAIEQLKIWGERTGSPVVSSRLGADAAGLAYEAFEQAKAAGAQALIIDTAGRLQNKAELMSELEKIVRVLKKLDPEAPHTVLQTVDATTGQNAMNQVEIFRNVAGVSGLVMTKLDGTARGGILVAISAKHRLPVYFIGVGEQVDDLEPFSAGEFARAIAGASASQ